MLLLNACLGANMNYVSNAGRPGYACSFPLNGDGFHAPHRSLLQLE